MQRFFSALSLFLILFSPIAAFAQMPDDPFFTDQWYLEQIDAETAWDYTVGDENVTIAILDTGIDLDHEDIEENLWINEGEISGNGVDDDGNGYIDDIYGWDFISGDNDPMPDPAHESDEGALSHGTVVAGIAGAVGDNGIGITGVSWDISLMSLRMLDSEGGGTSTIAAEAIDYAVAQGADVINMSFAGEHRDPVMEASIQAAYEAGVVIIAAAGNEGRNIDLNNVFPVCYEGEDDWVIGVAASNALDKKTAFSNFGQDCTDISAPGTDMLATVFHDESEGYTAEYQAGWAGTSMAAPVVAGAAALLLSAYPDLTPDDVAAILEDTSDEMNTTEALARRLGAGRLNIGSAMEYIDDYLAGNIIEDDDGNGGEENGPDNLIAIEDIEVGDYIRGVSVDTVYWISEEGERRAFINADAYFTHADSFDEIKWVDDDDLSNWSLTGLVLPKEGVVLVKIQSASAVYWLEPNFDDAFSPILREIDSEEIAIEMIDESWANFVIDVAPTYFTKFTKGEIIDEAIEVDTSEMRSREELDVLAS